MSTAQETESELRMSLELVEGPWKLEPTDIVHKFKPLASNDIKWIVRSLWRFQRLYANDLTWEDVCAALQHARRHDKTKSQSNDWTREAFKAAADDYIPNAQKTKRRDSRVVRNEEQPRAEYIEETTPRNSSSPLVEATPIGLRDESVMLIDRETTPPNVPRPETRQSSSGDSTAPVEVQEDIQFKITAMLEELESHNPVSTATLKEILTKFGLAQKEFNFAGDKVIVFGMRNLICSSASERTQDPEAGHEASEILHPASEWDIETRSLSDLYRDGMRMFVLPFPAEPEAPSVFYFLESSVCYIYSTTLAQENVLLTQTLPDKLIEDVAGLEGAKTWKTKLLKTQERCDRSLKDHPGEQDCGLQALASCLQCAWPNAHLPFSLGVDTGFWRAVLGTVFYESAGTRFFDDWLRGKWSPQEPAPTPIHGEESFHQHYPRSIKALEKKNKAIQRQSRLVRVLENDIIKLETWVRYARQRSVDIQGTIAAQSKEIGDRADSDIKTLEQKTKWNVEKCNPGTDPEDYREFLSKMKFRREQRRDKELDSLQIWEHAAEDSLKFQSQLMAVLETGKEYAQTMKTSAANDVQEANSLVQNTYREEEARIAKEQARIAAEQRRTAEAAKRASETFAGL